MQEHTSAGPSLADEIINRLDSLAREAEEAGKPLEVDPYRERLFELFVTAEAAGYLEEGQPPDLSADGVCHALAGRWGLAEATREWMEQQKQLPPQQLSRMRLLWSLMRMWMEWDYAWKRWPEFHGKTQQDSS